MKNATANTDLVWDIYHTKRQMKLSEQKFRNIIATINDCEECAEIYGDKNVLESTRKFWEMEWHYACQERNSSLIRTQNNNLKNSSTSYQIKYIGDN